jgi:hypothetical protein
VMGRMDRTCCQLERILGLKVDGQMRMEAVAWT